MGGLIEDYLFRNGANNTLLLFFYAILRKSKLKCLDRNV
jgi:hypothetical protein